MEDNDPALALDTGGADRPDHEVIDVSVSFAARIPLRPVRPIAEGLGLPRAGVERLITEGKLVSAVRLNGRLSGDFTFTFTLKRRALPGTEPTGRGLSGDNPPDGPRTNTGRAPDKPREAATAAPPSPPSASPRPPGRPG